MKNSPQPKRVPISELAGHSSARPAASASASGASFSGARPRVAAPEASPRPVAVSPAAANQHSQSSHDQSQNNHRSPEPSAMTDEHAHTTTLRDFLRSVYFYWRIGFMSAVVVLVLGILWWSNQATYSVATSSIIKKNMYFNWNSVDEFTRPLETDLSLMRSEQLGLVVSHLIKAVSNMSPTMRAELVKSDVPATDSRWPIEMGDARLTLPQGSMVIDYQTGNLLDRSAAFDTSLDVLIMSPAQATVLARAWKDCENAGVTSLLRVLREQPPQSLVSAVNVTGSPDSGEITITCAHSNQSVAAFIANVFPLAFVTSHDHQVRSRNAQEIRDLDRLLREALGELVAGRSKLKDLQRRLDEQLQGQDGASTLGTAGLDWQSMRARQGEIQGEIREFEDTVYSMTRELHTLNEQYRPLADPDLAEIQRLRNELRRMEATQKPNSPGLVEPRRRLAIMEADYAKRDPDQFAPMNNFITMSMQRSISDLREQLGRAESRLQLSREQKAELRVQLERYPDLSSPLIKYEIAEAHQQEKVNELTGALESARVRSQRVPEYYSWKTSATAADARMSSKSSYLFAIVLMAMLAGVTMTRVAAMVDNRVQTESQVRQITHKPVLLNLPVLGKANRYIYRETGQGRRTNSFIYNLFGILGVNIRHLGRQDHPEKLLCVTSAVPNEGKSFVAFNLAAYYALQGMNTCLLHCDYRHPTLEMFPDLDVDSIPGFIELLAGNGEINTLDECIYPTDIESLYVCLPGRITAPPIHLLDQPGFGEFLDDLQRRFDVVIMDCAPLLLVVDTAIIARHARATLLVAGMGVVKKNSMEMCIDRLNIQGINVLGTVVNRDRMAAWNYYSHYYGDIVLTTAPGADYLDPASGTATALAGPGVARTGAAGAVGAVGAVGLGARPLQTNLGGAQGQTESGGTGSGTWAAVRSSSGTWPAPGRAPSSQFDALLDATISSGKVLIPGPDRSSNMQPVIYDQQVVGTSSGNYVGDETAAASPQAVWVNSTSAGGASVSDRREPIVPEMDTLPRASSDPGDPFGASGPPSPLPGQADADFDDRTDVDDSVFDDISDVVVNDDDLTGHYRRKEMRDGNGNGDNQPPPPFNTNDDFHDLH